MIKHIVLSNFETSNDESDANKLMLHPSYQVTNLKYVNNQNLEDPVYVGQSYSVQNIIQSYFINNEFFKNSEIENGTYTGSGTTKTHGAIETSFYPNLIFIYSNSQENGYFAMGILYPKLGYGKMFYAVSANNEELKIKSYAHGLITEYDDGVTSFYNSFFDAKANAPVMDAQLNSTKIIYNWVAFG